MPRSSHHRPRRPRLATGLLLPVVLAAVVAACNGAATPAPTVTQPPPPTAVATPSAAAPTLAPTPAPTAAPTAAGSASCAPTELAVTGGPWDSAAGSRFAEVTVQNGGAAACTLPEGPAIAVTDAGGSVLVATDPAGATPGPVLEAGASSTFTVQFANWCDDSAILPVHVLFAIAGGGIEIVDLAAPTTDELPPCNGPDLPPTLTASDWTTG